MPEISARHSYIARQVSHWTLAASRLRRIEDLASAAAWEALEQYLGVALRRCLLETVDRLERQGTALGAALGAARGPTELEAVRRQLLAFRGQYARTETTIDFYADAINTRSSPEIGALLRACDTLAYRSLAHVLDQLGKPTPLVLTYIDKGLGASILKAGLRLWDQGAENPAAAIKIVRHNLYRPTALIHEAGHQLAHIVGWTPELAAAIETACPPGSEAIGRVWAGWASEIAADTFAFVHTGYASVAGLHDVVAEDRFVFRYIARDPHPVAYIRVLLGVEMCRQFYGAGPWDELAASWTETQPLQNAPAGVRDLLAASLALLPRIVDVCLRTPMRAFDGRPLAAVVNPDRVRPDALLQMEAQLGPALYTSLHWVWTEALRLLALTGYRAATAPVSAVTTAEAQERWMFTLGSSLRAA